MGNDVFEVYWRNYPRYKAPEKLYTGFGSFVVWAEYSSEVNHSIKDSVRSYAAIHLDQ